MWTTLKGIYKNEIPQPGFEAYQLNFDNYDSNKTDRWFRELPEWLQSKNAKTQEARIKNDYGWLCVKIYIPAPLF